MTATETEKDEIEDDVTTTETEKEEIEDNVTTTATPTQTTKGKQSSDDDETNEDKSRRVAMDKKRTMQQLSAEKEMKRRGDVLLAEGLGVGAVITVKVDYRMHSHAQGLVSIVYKYSETGGTVVCCESGVLTHDGSKRDYYVPSDKYKLMCAASESAVIPEKLQKVRNDILQGKYDYENMPRISYSKYHQEVMGATSPCKRAICGCKGKCTNRCGCRRKNLDCTSTCGCSGNCNWRDNE